MKNEKYEYLNLQIILIYYYHKPIFIFFLNSINIFQLENEQKLKNH